MSLNEYKQKFKNLTEEEIVSIIIREDFNLGVSTDGRIDPVVREKTYLDALQKANSEKGEK